MTGNHPLSQLLSNIREEARSDKAAIPDQIAELRVMRQEIDETILFLEEERRGPLPTDDVPIRDMWLSARTTNCLINMGVDTVGDVRRRSARELLREPNFGPRSLGEVRARIGRLKPDD